MPRIVGHGRLELSRSRGPSLEMAPTSLQTSWRRAATHLRIWASMRSPFEAFLRQERVIRSSETYGRALSVTAEGWRLSDDPRRVKPKAELLASNRTAADAAALARMAASLLPEHGFHKPSGAWWGSDGERFYRFRIHGRRPGFAAVVLASGVAGAAAIYLGLRHARRGHAKA